MFARIRASLDDLDLPADARLLLEDERGIEKPIGGEGPTVMRAYVVAEHPSEMCEAIDSMVAPLGSVVATSSQEAGSIPKNSGTECVTTGRLTEDDGGFTASVRDPVAYRNFLMGSDETAAFARAIDASVGSVVVLEIQLA